MSDIRKFIAILTTLIMICMLIPACAEDVPEWTYPIDPEILANHNGYITLANRNVLLDEDYEPRDLVNMTLRSVVSEDQLRKDAAQALSDMFADAEEAGYKLYIKSAYRSYRTQATMYYNRLEKLGYDDQLVSYPGASDHQTGLGVDVLNYEWTQKDGMNERFAAEEEAQWMANHCHEYGYVIRYLPDKEDITMINYEPWHLRYVGKEVAAYMAEKNLCLEEFTQEWQSYVANYEQQGLSFDMLLRIRSLPSEIIVVDTDENGEQDFSMFY